MKHCIFAMSESTTFPVRTAYQGGTFLFIATMKYNKQPLDIPAQIAMLKGRGQNIADESFVQKVKQACKMIVGVTSVKVQKTPLRTEDITQTAGYKAAMDDVKHGRVTEYAALEDFYKEMGL